MTQRTKRTVITSTVFVLVIGYALLLWRGPWWLDGAHLRERGLQPADGVVITGFRTTLVALGAGAVAALGLWYTHRNHKLAQRQFEQTQEQFKLTQEQFAHTQKKDRDQASLTREGQVTERYVEAIKLLASDRIAERLGGIYSLERIMNDSNRDKGTIVEVLAAFIRENARIASEPFETPIGYVAPEDVQAAFTVLVRREVQDGENVVLLPYVDLRGVTLRGGRFDNLVLGGARFDRGMFWDVSLTGANLTSVNFSNVTFHGGSLSGSVLYFADFQHAHLSDIDMDGSVLQSVNFKEAVLHGCSMRDVDLQNAVIDQTVIVDCATLSPEDLAKAKIRNVTHIPDRLISDPAVIQRLVECGREQDSADSSEAEPRA
ncbi:pentapeptide repeat-containing protein [Streptomyces decoyicus]|uniref:pentapeptide repeat-containing protein n=1 Tax=Streptomyces decoyicus TaxID=249567 RepID=UPI00386B97BB|nr:pentapeptide repeat-containing protein [Streptomyces decoyicus]